jgi:hypothetical protein
MQAEDGDAAAAGEQPAEDEDLLVDLSLKKKKKKKKVSREGRCCSPRICSGQCSCTPTTAGTWTVQYPQLLRNTCEIQHALLLSLAKGPRMMFTMRLFIMVGSVAGVGSAMRCNGTLST